MSEILHKQRENTVSNSKNAQILMAALLGVLIVFVVALAPIEVVHNATHDVRHSSGYPCH